MTKEIDVSKLIDKMSFMELAEQSPEDVCRRAVCRYDHIDRCYTLSVWGEEYAIYPHELKIESITSNFTRPHDYFYIFLVNYLLQANETKLCEEWISEKDILGGSAFFRGPHEIPTNLISSRYSGNIEEFNKICQQLGGTPLNMADASYSFQITPRVLVAVLYWDGDEDFPPESKILYDKSIAGHIALDIIFALAVDICSRIGRASLKMAN